MLQHPPVTPPPSSSPPSPGVTVVTPLGKQMLSNFTTGPREERVRSFEMVLQEKALTTGDDKTLAQGWPLGEVTFEGVQMRYRGPLRSQCGFPRTSPNI